MHAANKTWAPEIHRGRTFRGGPGHRDAELHGIILPEIAEITPGPH